MSAPTPGQIEAMFPGRRRTVAQLNRALGLDLLTVRSFRADVRIDFDEYGNILATSILNPDTPPDDGSQ